MSAETGEVGSDKLPVMRMLGNAVLLEPLTPETSSVGGILYPAGHAPEKMLWRVLAVGPGLRKKNGVTVPVEVKPGDKVLFNMNRVGNKHAFADGRVLVDGDLIEMQWL